MDLGRGTAGGVGNAFLYIMRKGENASRLDMLAIIWRWESMASTYPFKSLVDEVLRILWLERYMKPKDWKASSKSLNATERSIWVPFNWWKQRLECLRAHRDMFRHDAYLVMLVDDVCDRTKALLDDRYGSIILTILNNPFKWKLGLIWSGTWASKSKQLFLLLGLRNARLTATVAPQLK